MTKYQTKLRAVKYVIENNATYQEAAQKYIKDIKKQIIKRLRK